MTLFEKLNKLQTAVLVVSIAVLAAGCQCGSKSSGGSYYSAYTPAPYTETSVGASETKTEVQTGTNMVIPLYEETLAVGTRQVEQGTVKLKKVVKTETVNQPVQLRKETIVIEREPASGDSSASTANAFKEQETVIQLWREEPVVETRIVPAGRIVASRKYETESSTVSRQVRKEDIEMDKSGESQNVIISGNVSGSEASGGGGDTSSQTSGQSASSPITSVSTITGSSDPSALAQRSVRLANLKVDKVYSGRLVEVQDDAGRPLFIRLNETLPNVQSGDTLSVAGTVKLIPASMQDLGFGEEAKAAMRNRQVFVDAQKFEATSR